MAKKTVKKSAGRSKKWVYFFGDGKADGKAQMKNLLGGKGANLAEMVNLGIPVPPGFTITTEVCTEFYNNRQRYPQGVNEQVAKALFGKGVRLGQLNRSEEAIDVYDDLVKRYGDDQTPALREQMANALFNKGVTLGQWCRRDWSRMNNVERRSCSRRPVPAALESRSDLDSWSPRC